MFESYGNNEDKDENLIRDLFLEYKEKWDIKGDYFDYESKGRYLLVVEFSHWNEENNTIIKSKVNTSTINEFKRDMELFVNRIKKYAKICFLSWIQEQEDYGDYSEDKFTNDNQPIYGAVWIHIDFCTSRI